MKNSGGMWNRRASLPRINRGLAAVLMLLIPVTSGFLQQSVGSSLSICISAALAAFLITADRSPMWLLSLPLSYGAAFLVTGDPVESLFSLIYIVPAAALALCVYKELQLNAVCAICGIVSGLCLVAMLAYELNILYGSPTAVSQLYSDVRGGLIENLSGLQYPGADGEKYALSDSDISSMVESVVMFLPAMAALLMEALGYITAKVYRLATVLSRTDFMFENGVWRLSLSLPAALIFIVCYIVSLFARGGVIGYTVLNLMYIVMPAAAVAGCRSMFGKGSRFRNGMRTAGKVIMIILCVAAVYVSPALLAMLFGFWGSAATVAGALRRFIRNKGSEDNNNG